MAKKIPPRKARRKVSAKTPKGARTKRPRQVKQDGPGLTLPVGYDVRDLYIDKGPEKAIQALLQGLTPLEVKVLDKEQVSSIQPILTTSWRDLCRYYQAVDETGRPIYHFSETIQQTLAVMLAVVISTDLPSDQLFLRVLGPPGSGKSFLAEVLAVAKEYVYSRDVIRGFHSGFITKKRAQGEKEAGLIERIKNKTFVLKDADTLLQTPNLSQILSEIRAIYDGKSRAEYRNLQTDSHEDIQSTLIFCGTDTLRSLNRATAGERFFDIECLGDESTDPYLQAALSTGFHALTKPRQNGEEEPWDHDIKRATYGYICWLKDNLSERVKTLPPLSQEASQCILGLGQALAYMRASVNQDAYKPRPELATRLIKQFQKLAYCLLIVLNRKEVDRHILGILQKVCRDTAYGYQGECILFLSKHQRGASTDTLCKALGQSKTKCRLMLEDLRKLGVIKTEDFPNGSPAGRNKQFHKLTDHLRGVMEMAGFSIPKTFSDPRKVPKRVPKKVPRRYSS